jgi:hypothetical protein
VATDPITAARYPAESDSGDVALWIQRAVNDLSSKTLPTFSTTTLRDNAYQAAITAGTIASIPDGSRCSVNGVPYRRIAGTWRIDRNRNIVRIAVLGSGSGAVASGGSTETGLTTGASLTGGGSFTLYEASTVAVSAAFRAGPGTGAAQCTVKIDSTVVGNVAISRTDATVPVIGAVALAAGSHSISMRVDAIAGTANWIDGIVTLTEGTAE